MKKHNKKKEILIYCPVIEIGGVATTLVKVSNYLCQYYDIKIFTNCINKYTKKSLKKKILIFDIRKKRLLKNRIYNSFFVYLLLKKNVTENSIIFSLIDHFTILILNKLILRKKIIIRTSGVIFNKNNREEANNYKYKNFKILVTYFYKLANVVITYSKENVKTLKSMGMKKVICIYNYFEKKEFYKIKKHKKFNIFFIGRLSKEKDPIFFLRNLINFKNINLHFVANGKMKEQLVKIANNKKNALFHGYVNNPFKKFKNKINLLCITSKYEGTPNVLGEAMAHKVPILAPKNIGLVNFFLKNGKYGYLYNQGNDVSFKKKVIHIMDNYDEALKKTIKGYKSLNRFSKERTLGVIKKILDKI